ncbi:MAG: hypothetical protein KA250_14335 [Verrucomicrobiales bacterium]|nr:hypothetical protein [Verrucomicrobiales bacterium]
MRNLFRSRRTFWTPFLVAFWAWIPGQPAHTADQLPSLRARFEEVLQQIETPYQTLNTSYLTGYRHFGKVPHIDTVWSALPPPPYPPVAR